MISHVSIKERNLLFFLKKKKEKENLDYTIPYDGVIRCRSCIDVTDFTNIRTKGMRCSSRAQNLQHRIVLACGITSSGVIESERTVVSINSSGSLLPTRIVVPQIPRQGWASGVAPPPSGSSGKLNAGGCSVFFWFWYLPKPHPTSVGIPQMVRCKYNRQEPRCLASFWGKVPRNRHKCHCDG